ncbi:hypothetical protein R2R35_01990 [Anaerocolumna sp. AGMB13020]|uniref:hypothetical protein n=1 Tax=Anaerocolumna sp. AGMB13020 TaxID=3081750 RepID=UPI0029558F9E|nr:hypothetical protein [Anaerocolumna sp. AGMB13020]WOO37287.1 hypothetical protein R2R35_01990 [Anaerocolumna sp. AGMB13020]
MKKNKIITVLCTLMLFIPWSLIVLRSNDWALKSPTAEIMIGCYSAFMVFGGIFTIANYIKNHNQNVLMKICLIINGMYGIVGAVALLLMLI